MIKVWFFYLKKLVLKYEKKEYWQICPGWEYRHGYVIAYFLIYIVSNQHWHSCVVLYFLTRYNCGYFCFMFRITFFLIYFLEIKLSLFFFTERGSKIVNNLSDILWLFFYLNTWPLLFGYFWNSALAGLVVFFVHRKSCNNLAKVHTSGLPKLPTSKYTRIQH